MDSFFGLGIVEALDKATGNRAWLTRSILWVFIVAGLLWATNFVGVPAVKGLLGMVSGDPQWAESATGALGTMVVALVIMALLSNPAMRLFSRRYEARLEKTAKEAKDNLKADRELRDRVDQTMDEIGQSLAKMEQRRQWFDSELLRFSDQMKRYGSHVLTLAGACDDPVLKGQASALADEILRLGEVVTSHLDAPEEGFP